MLPSSPDYPKCLLALPDPPEALFVRGTVPEGPKVAIVGTRRASRLGQALARSFAEALAGAGVSVVSGGALGIDAAAHAGAITAGGRTIVVLPGPLHRPVPAQNVGLFRRALDHGGAWVSEVSGPVRKWHFMRRNRIIAALADVVLLVEAGAHSGTRHTLRAARALGRPVGAVPWSVSHAEGLGCLAALREGAAMVASVDDVRALLPESAGPDAKLEPPRAPEPAGLGAEGLGAASSPDAARLLAAVQRGSDRPAELAVALGWSPARTAAAVSELELAGAIERRPGGALALAVRGILAHSGVR